VQGRTIENLRAPRRARAYLAATADHPVLLLASSEEEAERYARDARCFTGETVVHLPSRGVLYGDVFGPPVTRVGERQRALHALSGARLIVAGPLAFAEKTPLYEPLRLEGGVELELDTCLSRLVELGYERVDRVSRHGEFAVRGGIVDVFPSTRRSPVRVEWWGDEVESVRAVSLATQRVVRELASVVVHAAREGDLASLAATGGDDLPEEARQGVRVPGLDRLLLNLNPISARELLPQDVAVWAEEPGEGLPEDADDVVRELYDFRSPEPDLRFVTTTEEARTVSALPVVTPSSTIRGCSGWRTKGCASSSRAAPPARRGGRPTRSRRSGASRGRPPLWMLRLRPASTCCRARSKKAFRTRRVASR
jgi:transcription-repair coupling factor (superfamily II helicase)